MAKETSVVVSSFSFLPGRLKTLNFASSTVEGVVRVFLVPLTPFLNRSAFLRQQFPSSCNTCRSHEGFVTPLLSKTAVFHFILFFEGFLVRLDFYPPISTPFETWAQPLRNGVCWNGIHWTALPSRIPTAT